MRQFCKAAVIAALVAASAAARSAPPTVTPSPGYDARLQEQRAAAARATPQAAAPVTPRHHRKSKGN
jgi:hypothetical protein